MDEDNLKSTVITSLFWKFLQTCGTSGVAFIISIILARLLLPEDFGIIALITVFIAVSNIFIQSGFSTALIQNKDVTDVDYSSVFFVTLGIATLMYAILFIASPLVAVFYNQPIITPVLRVLGLSLFFGAVNSIQYAIVARGFLFKKYFVCSFFATLISGIIGVIIAYLGYGVWALVAQQLISIISLCIIMLLVVRWRPKLKFSLVRIKALFSYGWKVMISGFIVTLYHNMTVMIVGKLYPADMVGYYSKGREYPNLLVPMLTQTIQSVLFPAFSKSQDNPVLLKQIMHRSLTTSTFIIFPAMFGLLAVAEPAITILLTEKWLMCVPFLQIFCLYFMSYPIQAVNNQALLGVGKSGTYFKLEMIIIAIAVVLLVISISFGIYAVAVSVFIASLFATYLYAFPAKKLFNYSFWEQCKDMLPTFILSVVMAVIVSCISLLNLSPLVTLIIQMIVGISIYFGMAWILKLEVFTYIINSIKEITRDKTEKLPI